MDRRGQRLRAARTAAAALLASSAVLGGAGVAGAAEGRAYELVSPPDKNGNSVFFVASGSEASNQMGNPLLVAPDGNGAAFGSTGVYADDPTTGGYGSFISKRTGSGWGTQYVTPRLQDRPSGLLGFIPLMYDRLWPEERMFFVSRGATAADQVLWQTAGDGSNPVPLSIGSLGLARASRVVYGGRSADGSHVVFMTQALLEPGVPRLNDLNNGWHLYERLPEQGITRPVDVLPDDTIPASGGKLGSGILNGGGGTSDGRWHGDGSRHAISADGRVIFFQVQPSFETPDELYARVDGERTLRLSEPTMPGGTAPTRGALYQAATADGSSVFFLSDAQLTPDAPTSGTNLYRWTFDAARTDGTLTLISRDDLGAATRAEIGLVGNAEDGRSGWFTSTAALGDEGTAGRPNLYRFDDDGPRFVTTLAATDQVRIVSARVSSGRDYLVPQARVTPDGTRLVFKSSARVTAFDNGGHAQIYLAVDDDAPICISCGIVGGEATADAKLTEELQTSVIAPPRNISDDGRWIFFSSGDPLVPEDANGVEDVYQWHDGEVSLVSSGLDSEPSKFVGASADDGVRDVFFVTSEALVGQDIDTQIDLYNARVGGGFPAPPAPPAPCAADCQGPPSPAPFIPVPGSSLVTGAGNATDDGQPRGARAASFSIGRVTARQRAALAKSGRLTLRVRTNAPGEVTAVARARAGRRWRAAGVAARTLRKAGAVHLRLALARDARARLSERGRLVLRIDVRHSRASAPKRASFTLHAAKRAAHDKRAQRATTTGAQRARIRQGGSDA